MSRGLQWKSTGTGEPWKPLEQWTCQPKVTQNAEKTWEQETLGPSRVETALEAGEPGPSPAEWPVFQQDHLQTWDSTVCLEWEPEAALLGLCLVSGNSYPQRASKQ